MADKERKKEKHETQKLISFSVLGKYSAVISIILAVISALFYYLGSRYYAAYVKELGLDSGMFPLDFPGVIAKGAHAFFHGPGTVGDELLSQYPILSILLLLLLVVFVVLVIIFRKSTFWKFRLHPGVGIPIGLLLFILWLASSELSGEVEANNVVSGEKHYFLEYEKKVSVLYDFGNSAREIKGFIILSSEQYCAVCVEDSTILNPQIIVIPRERIQLIKIEHLKLTDGSDSTQAP